MAVVLLGGPLRVLTSRLRRVEVRGSLAQDQAAVLVHEAVAGGTADLSRLGWRFP